MVSQKILIVDDSSLNRDILTFMLEGAYQIVEAENGLKAIEQLKMHGHEFSLVLLDLMMPVCDGYGVLAYMKESRLTEEIPVVVISAETDQSMIGKAYDMGAVDFISRPLEPYIVQRRVKNTLALYEKQRRLTAIIAKEIQERTKSYDRMLTLLSQIVEFRNHESGLHVLHIKIITEMLTKQILKKTDQYHLSETDVQMISMASALHDIGKITVPDEILNKPGRLTEEEFEVVKGHSAAGADLIKTLPSYQEDPVIGIAYDICRWHHERYDGKGYPDGLSGDEIPISAQIVALADVYDALTSIRCYKAAYTHEKALEMIRNGECGAFNPLLLECLMEVEERLKNKMKLETVDPLEAVGKSVK
ncbi:MAG: HD domain-containing phosphohydrolase [Bariatricus sp.]